MDRLAIPGSQVSHAERADQVRRAIPLWISIPWWFVALGILLNWMIHARGDDRAFQWEWAPFALWIALCHRMREPSKPYPRWPA